MQQAIHSSKKDKVPAGNAYQTSNTLQAKSAKPPPSGIGFADKQGSKKKKKN